MDFDAIEYAIGKLKPDKFLNSRAYVSKTLIKHKCILEEISIGNNIFLNGDNMDLINFHKNIINKYFHYIKCKYNSFYITSPVCWDFNNSKVILVKNNENITNYKIALAVINIENIDRTLAAFNDGGKKYGVNFDIITDQQMEVMKDKLQETFERSKTIREKIDLRTMFNNGQYEIVKKNGKYETCFIDYHPTCGYYIEYSDKCKESDISIRLVYNPKVVP